MKYLSVKSVTMIALAISLIVLGSALAPALKAAEADQLTKITFSGPVEIPGQVLSAGTYVFKILDFGSPNIVQIFNEDQNKVYATILAIPDYRLKSTDKTVITFEERAANAPPAVKAWFYPGDNFGHEFVYPKVRAVQLAKITHEPVASMPQNLEASTKVPAKTAQEPSVAALKKAEVKAEQPSGEEVEVAQVFQAPPTQVAQAQPAPALPKTGSDLPLFGLVGLILAGTGFLMRFAAKRLS